MRGSNIITINGRLYDALSGMPVTAKQTPTAAPTAASTPPPAASRPTATNHQPAQARTIDQMVRPAGSKPTLARGVHARPQKSKTLMRSVLKAPHAAALPKPAVKRSPHIQRFSAMAPARHHVKPAPETKAVQQPVQTALPVAAPATSQPSASPANGSQLKEALIKQQLRQVDVPTVQPRDHKPARRFPRAASIFSGVAALALLAGYLTYLNLPSLSIKVAAAQAGFAATYPAYQPAGYSFNGPVAYTPGEVKVHFASNTNDYHYTLVQQASSWDSRAVLDNFVTKQSQEYATLQERGLTIYLYDNKATWVNGGVLYVIDGNAPLSSEQIQKIASSTL